MTVDDDNPFLSPDISSTRGPDEMCVIVSIYCFVMFDKLFSNTSRLSIQQLRDKQAQLARLMQEIDAQIGMNTPRSHLGQHVNSGSHDDEDIDLTAEGYERDDFVVDDEAEDEDEGGEDGDEEDVGQEKPEEGDKEEEEAAEEEEDEEVEEDEQPRRPIPSKVLITFIIYELRFSL